MRASNEGCLMEGLTRLLPSIGKDQFYERLLNTLGTFASHSAEIAVRYVPGLPPDDVILLNYPRHKTELLKRRSLEFDPFYRYWREGVVVPVVTTAHVVSGPRQKSPYVREFMPCVGITDDLGLFLPPIAGNTIGLFLERSSGRFTAAEVERVRGAYPLFVELHRSHVTRVFDRMLRGETDHLETAFRGPVLITDRSGRTVLATSSWKKAEQCMAGLRDAVTDLVNAGDAVPVDGYRLEKEPLAGQLLVLREGWLFSLQRDREITPPRDPASAIGNLTRREGEIVDLILRGYPASAIASRLGIARATVKNHKRNIYEKLDITTERELFVMTSLARPPGSVRTPLSRG